MKVDLAIVSFDRYSSWENDLGQKGNRKSG